MARDADWAFGWGSGSDDGGAAGGAPGVAIVDCHRRRDEGERIKAGAGVWRPSKEERQHHGVATAPGPERRVRAAASGPCRRPGPGMRRNETSMLQLRFGGLDLVDKRGARRVLRSFWLGL